MLHAHCSCPNIGTEATGRMEASSARRLPPHPLAFPGLPLSPLPPWELKERHPRNDSRCAQCGASWRNKWVVDVPFVSGGAEAGKRTVRLPSHKQGAFVYLYEPRSWAMSSVSCNTLYTHIHSGKDNSGKVFPIRWHPAIMEKVEIEFSK